jgi:hypothetical protein
VREGCPGNKLSSDIEKKTEGGMLLHLKRERRCGPPWSLGVGDRRGGRKSGPDGALWNGYISEKNEEREKKTKTRETHTIRHIHDQFSLFSSASHSPCFPFVWHLHLPLGPLPPSTDHQAIPSWPPDDPHLPHQQYQTPCTQSLQTRRQTRIPDVVF